ncbi:MAG: hypothetical protein WDN46_00200 [Methylocella sp.]
MNLHIPFAEIGERWSPFMRQKWSCSQDAYAMEQRVFDSLSRFRTEGERIRCAEIDLKSAWATCLAADGDAI